MPEFIVKAEIKQIVGGKKGIYTPKIDIIRGDAEDVAYILNTKYSHSRHAPKGFTSKVVKAFKLTGETLEFIDWCMANKEELEKLRQLR